MNHAEGRWQDRLRVIGTGLRRRRLAALEVEETGGAPASSAALAGAALKAKIGASAFAFRGYDVSNLGRTPELVEHRVYGPVVKQVLDEASAICAEAIHAPVDLVSRALARIEGDLADFPQEVAMIVGIELAQTRLLEEFFDVPVRQAKLSFGYSIGELSALVLGNMYRLDQLLPIPLAMAKDCAELAADTHMGILFTRAPILPEDDVQRLCVSVSSEGHGMIGPSAYLSPNTALILGQGDTLDRLEKKMHDFLPEKVMLRRNPNKWPPLHTPLVWQRNIPNRTAVALYQLEGGAQLPVPPVISCVTGEASYDTLNSRDLLTRWTDHPQRLWDAIDGTLSSGVETVLHVGPGPNLIPATFTRLSNNVAKQLGNGYLHKVGKGFVQSMRKHAWLANLLPHKANLLRAPFLEHIILEDWLLEQKVD
jgi:[acyl-carrier-protein] S-malonyltransferase